MVGGKGRNLGHNNRIFALKFIPEDENVLMTSGWDKNCNIWDLREKKTVNSFICGKIAGDSLDYKNGTILTGLNNASD